jgi:hypothetical protein
VLHHSQHARDDLRPAGPRLHDACNAAHAKSDPLSAFALLAP